MCTWKERETGVKTPRVAIRESCISEADKVVTGRSLPHREFGKGVCGKGIPPLPAENRNTFQNLPKSHCWVLLLCNPGAHGPLSKQLPAYLLPASQPPEGRGPG